MKIGFLILTATLISGMHFFDCRDFDFKRRTIGQSYNEKGPQEQKKVRKRPESSKEFIDIFAAKSDSATATVFYVVDSVKLGEQDSILKYVIKCSGLFYHTPRRQKALRTALFSRPSHLTQRDSSLFPFVGFEGNVSQEFLDEWKSRYVAHYDMSTDTLILYPESAEFFV